MTEEAARAREDVDGVSLIECVGWSPFGFSASQRDGEALAWHQIGRVATAVVSQRGEVLILVISEDM